MTKVTKNLSKIQVNTQDTQYELTLPKTDSSGNLENVAYTNITNTFKKPQEFNLEATSDYESTELKGKSTKFDRVSGTFTSGTENTIMLTSLYDKNNKLIADSTLQVSGDKTLSYLEVLNKEGTPATLGIAFNASTNKFETFAPETTEDSPSNSIVTKGYLDNFVPSGSGTISIEDATNSVKGIVLLSDSAGTADAATGHTAVTPLALKNVKEKLEEQIAQGSTDLGYIVTPIITSPTNESTNQSTLVNIIGTAFKSVFDDDTRTTRQFQVATDSSFSSIVKDKNINADSWVVEAPQLSDSTKYYIRIRDKATSGFNSAWSPTVEFTTGQGLRPTDPVITLKGYNNSPTDILSGLTIETSEFEVSGGEDTHKATSWSITTKNRTPVWESPNDTTHKTSITVPEGTLQKSTEYVLTVIFHGTNYGDSNPVTKEFTTSNDFGTVNPPTLSIEGFPDNIFDTPTLTAGAFSNTRDTDIHEMTDWKIVSAASEDTVIWESLSNTSNKTSIKVDAGNLQPNTAYIAKVRYKGAKYEWSDWTSVPFSTIAQFAFINKPTLTVEGFPNSIPQSPLLQCTPFSGTNVTYRATVFYIYKDGEEVWVSGDISQNSVQVPSNILKPNTQYTFFVIHVANEYDLTMMSDSVVGTIIAEPAKENDIGTPGQMGFGVGICSDLDGLAELKLEPMEGTTDINSDNYGNYQRTDGKGVWVYVPAFCYKFETNEKSPSYFTVKSFKDFDFNETTANEQGYTLHRAFIDGDIVQKGFFISKYLMSSSINSIKNGVPIVLTNGSSSDYSGDEEYEVKGGGEGKPKDAIGMSKFLGTNYTCASAFMYSALAMLSLVHGWNSNNTNVCAWYDAEGVTNFPKGCNNNSLGDRNDNTILYTSSGNTAQPNKPKTGSANYFAKTTHNGQNNGVCDLNGCVEQVVLGILTRASDGFSVDLYTMKSSVKLSEFTKDNVQNDEQLINFYDKAIQSIPILNKHWGNLSSNAFYTDNSGVNRALCGVWPKVLDSAGTNEFGIDSAIHEISQYALGVLRCSGVWSSVENTSGIFYRKIRTHSNDVSNWESPNASTWGFRTGAYLPPSKKVFDITILAESNTSGFICTGETVHLKTNDDGTLKIEEPSYYGINVRYGGSNSSIRPIFLNYSAVDKAFGVNAGSIVSFTENVTLKPNYYGVS